jgi:tellurite resistance protein
MSKIDQLFKEYTEERYIKLNREQFVYIVNLFPALRVVMSDGIMDQEEWITVKRLAKILGDEFASEDLGEEKEENLMLIYRAEFRHLLKNLDKWQSKFISALKDYFNENVTSKEFVVETMYLFASASDGVSAEENEVIEYLTKELELEDIEL